MIYLFLALIFYTGVVLTGAAAARNANITLVAAISNLVSAIIPIILVIPLLNKQTFTTQKIGVYWALIDGVFIALFALALFKSFTENKVGVVAPIIYGGTILLSTVLSYFIFKEKINLTEGIGLALILAGFSVIIYARATIN